MARRRKRLTKSEALQGSQNLSQSLMQMGMYQEREKAAKESREERERSKASQVRQRDQDYALGKERLALDRDKFEAEEAREQAKLGKVEDTKIRAYEELARDYQDAVKEAEANERYEVLSSEQERVFAKKLQGLTAGNEALLSGLGQDGRITSPEMVPLVLQALRHTEDRIRAELPPDTSERMENLLLGSTRTLRRQLEEMDGGLRSIAMQRARGPRFGGFSGQEPLPEPDYNAMEQEVLARAPAIRFLPWNGGESGTVPDFLSYAKAKRPGLTSEDLMRDMADARVQNIFGRVAPGATVADFRDLDVYQNETPFASERLTQAFGPQEAPETASDVGLRMTSDDFEEDVEGEAPLPQDRQPTSLGTKAFGRQGPSRMFEGVPEMPNVFNQGGMGQGDQMAGQPQRSRVPLADAYGRNVLSPIQQFMQERQPAMNAGPTPGLGGMGGHDARREILQLPLHLLGGIGALGELGLGALGQGMIMPPEPQDATGRLEAFLGPDPRAPRELPFRVKSDAYTATPQNLWGGAGGGVAPQRYTGPQVQGEPADVRDPMSFQFGGDPWARMSEPMAPAAPRQPAGPMGTATQALMRAAALRAMSEPLGIQDQIPLFQSLLEGLGGY